MLTKIVDSEKRPRLASFLREVEQLDDVILAFKAQDAAAINVHGRLAVDDIKTWNTGHREQMLVLLGSTPTATGEKGVHVHVDWDQVVEPQLSTWRSSYYPDIPHAYRVSFRDSDGHDLFWFYAHALPAGRDPGLVAL
jgi:hypothetical protein